MMYSTEVNIWSVTRKQYIYKLHALFGAFGTLTAVQILAFIFSFGGTGSLGVSYSGISVTVQYYSSDGIFLFTLIWAFITGITINYRSYRDAEFFFVTNRLVSNLSNIAFLLTASLAAGVTTVLLGSTLKLSLYLTTANGHIIDTANIALPPGELLIGILVAALSAALLSCFGYVVGMLVQLSKLFIIVLPVLFFGFSNLENMTGYGFLSSAFKFYGGETSLLLFSLKVILTLVLLYALTILMSNRMEVRR